MKFNFPRIFQYMIVNNVSAFASLCSDLKVSENKTKFLFKNKI